MLLLQDVSYLHPNKEKLFEHINLSAGRHDKIALVGNNGTGKSTLLHIIAGKLPASHGQVSTDAAPYYIPQVIGQYNHLSVAQALQVDDKLRVLKAILEGDTDEKNFALLGDDWTIEERCKEALEYWQLDIPDLSVKMGTLSGGQKTKVFLAGITIHQPALVLLDEPTNHLDTTGRSLLYDFIKSTTATLIIVSHDRQLLNLLNPIFELSKSGLLAYGGNFDFYEEQKGLAQNALMQDIHSREKELRKAREKQRQTIERQQKLDARGKGKQEKAGIARIMMNTLRNNAENSTSKLKSIHSEKIEGISQELLGLRSSMPDIDKMKLAFSGSALHTGKVLFTATDINLHFDNSALWKEGMSFQINSGERIALKGPNGSGKTSLINIILDNCRQGSVIQNDKVPDRLNPLSGSVYRAAFSSVYIDQDYSLLNNELKVYEQALQFNSQALQEHEIRNRLTRFLFGREDWVKPCSALSGGERMRLALCCLTIGNQAPDVMVLDEPTNNLDISNIEILTAAISSYEGTLVVVSHDQRFLEDIGITREINLAIK